MKEIEVKILEIDKEKVISILKENGAILKYSGHIEAFFFKNSKWQKIRLRNTGKWSNINYKIPISHSFWIANQEFETSIWDIEVIKKILLSIWFSEYGYSKKYRESYLLDTICFDIDTYEGVPTFVEIESFDSVNVEKWVTLLGYTMKDVVKLTERELKEYYNLV